jgi:hypothetical protein
LHGCAFIMKYDFHVHDVVRVEYRIATDGPSFPRGYSQIESEARVVGGSGAVAACALARWGATVLLTGNPIGEDSHGRFLVEQLSQVPNLTYEAQIEPEIETPYAILLKAGSHSVGTLLSPTAAKVPLEKRSQNSSLAGFYFGDRASFGEAGTPVLLRAPSQDYASVVASLEAAAVCYLSLLGEGVSPSQKSAFTAFVVEKYNAGFGGIETIATMEEIEASLRDER